jgi:hypothetical protein
MRALRPGVTTPLRVGSSGERFLNDVMGRTFVQGKIGYSKAFLVHAIADLTRLQLEPLRRFG